MKKLTGSAQRLRALVYKESLQIIRDPSSILIAFVLPIILLIIFGLGLSLDTSTVRVALVAEQSDNQMTQSLLASFYNSSYIDVVTQTQTMNQAEPLLVGAKVNAIVDIPSNFASREKLADINKFKNAEIFVKTDGSDPNIANFAANYIKAVWGVWMQQQMLNFKEAVVPITNMIPRYWYNEELKSRNFIFPGSFAIILVIIGALLTALVVAREWERGTMEALFATPVRLGELIVGKLIPYFCLGMGTITVCTILAIYVFDVPFRGSLFALYLASTLYMLSSLSLGLLISTITKDQFVASQMTTMIAFLPSMLLSGFVFEISSMPKWLQIITYVIPARYFVTCIKTIFMVGDVWALLLPNILCIAVITALLLGATLAKTQKRLM